MRALETQNGRGLHGLLELKRTPLPAGIRRPRTRTAPPASEKISIKTFFEDEADTLYKQRRIRVCVADVALQIGGAEWFSTLLMKYSNPRIFEFIVVCYRPADGGLQKHVESLGVKVVSASSVYGENVSYEEWLNDKFFTMLEIWNPDIVFFSSQYLYGEIASEKINQYRTVVRISNFDESLNTLDFTEVDSIICCSEEQNVSLAGRYPGKVKLIKTGVDLGQFQPLGREEKLAVRQNLGIPEKNSVILFCGRLGDPLKRTALFEQVVDRVLEKRKDVTFLVVGYFEKHRNAAEKEFSEFAESHRGGGSILWRKTVSPLEINEYFQASDVLLSVSARGEGLSNTVLQSLASGLVSVVTPASGMSDLIEDSVNGFLLEDDDPSFIAEKLLRAIDLPEQEKQAISHNARRHAELVFNLREKVADYERVLYGVYKDTPIRVSITDAVFGIGGAEWLAALLCLNSDSEKIGFSLVLHRDTSPLARWLAEQGIEVLAAPAQINYDQWREIWTPKTFRLRRPHVVMPCTSTSWNLSYGKHRFLGISQNASDRDVLQKSQYEGADYIICVSQDVMEVLDEGFHYKMTVLRNSIDPVMFHRNEESRRAVRERLGLADNQKAVLWTGRLAEHRKRVDILREVIRECSDFPELHFLVLGFFKTESEPEQQKQWEAFVKSQPNVTWVSGVSNWESPAYYSAADFYLSTSGYSAADFEGLSLAAVQALAAGLPIVTTASGGMREVVAEGVNGYLTEVGDSSGLSARLKNFCSAPDTEINAMRKRNIRKASEQFDIRTYARRYETICWTLKNTVDAALPYDAEADTELLDFNDEGLSAEQRHKASFFANHISPLWINNATELFPDGVNEDAFKAARENQSISSEQISGIMAEEISLLLSLADQAEGRVHHVRHAPQIKEDLPPALGLIVLHDDLSIEEINQGFELAEKKLVSGGMLVLRGCASPVDNENSGQETRRRARPACALLDYLGKNFPLWSQPFQVGSSVVMKKR